MALAKADRLECALCFHASRRHEPPLKLAPASGTAHRRMMKYLTALATIGSLTTAVAAESKGPSV
jgi:hypothetical protein